ncbi:uncharacterized protein LOC122680690 [Cervus elaphus]|uniref:uncharacterized protein LOC122680690 n=1 Tax=Cervus elaphus TaxID=9860 RepID=UPI001CC317D0|nr:uncharacterized protein LOC122680690 [Cervus elaphus]
MAPGAAPPVHGEGWRLDQPGPPRPPRAGYGVARRCGCLRPLPLGRPPVVGLGVRPTRLCHVCHPPSTHEHLSKIPEQETKVAFSSSSWAGSGASPAPLGSRRPCLRVAEAAEAPATLAGTEGTGGQWRPQTRRPRARRPEGWHRGLAPRPAGPALLCLPRCLAGATPPLSLPCFGAALRPPAPGAVLGCGKPHPRCEPGGGRLPQTNLVTSLLSPAACGVDPLCVPAKLLGIPHSFAQTSALDEHGWSESTSRKPDACRGLRKTLQGRVAVSAPCLGGRAAQEAKK